jgi:hypothetical protein
VPDHFDLLGNSGVARASRLQRAYRRRAAAAQAEMGAVRRAADPSAAHRAADSSAVRRPPEPARAAPSAPPGSSDVAVDFVDMTEIVARMQAAFHTEPR